LDAVGHPGKLPRIHSPGDRSAINIDRPLMTQGHAVYSNTAALEEAEVYLVTAHAPFRCRRLPSDAPNRLPADPRRPTASIDLQCVGDRFDTGPADEYNALGTHIGVLVICQTGVCTECSATSTMEGACALTARDVSRLEIAVRSAAHLISRAEGMIGHACDPALVWRTKWSQFGSRALGSSI